jgi:hypothetical protein
VLHVQYVDARAVACGVPQPSGSAPDAVLDGRARVRLGFDDAHVVRTEVALTQAEIVVPLKIDVFIGGIVVTAPSTSCDVFVDAAVRSPMLARNEPAASYVQRTRRKARRQFYERSALQQRT